LVLWYYRLQRFIVGSSVGDYFIPQGIRRSNKSFFPIAYRYWCTILYEINFIRKYAPNNSVCVAFCKKNSTFLAYSERKRKYGFSTKMEFLNF
jgi:hypothetical protein